MTPAKYTVIGLVDNAVFQQCREAAAYVREEYADSYDVKVVDLLPFEFEAQRQELHKSGRVADASWRVIVRPDDDKSAACLSGDAFVQEIIKATNFRLFDLPESDPNSYAAMARQSYRSSLKSRGNVYCWMVVSINGVPQPKIVFELFAKKLPRTCQNFLHLCRGDLPDAVDESKQKIRLCYKGTSFFRVVENGWVQAGDVMPPHKGNGGYSCFGRTFPDESFDVPHDAKGIVGMCNDGEDTNASAFYVTLRQSSWMNRSYVAFGRVVEGLDVLDAIASVETKHNQSPVVPVVIEDCGEVSLD